MQGCRVPKLLLQALFPFLFFFLQNVKNGHKQKILLELSNKCVFKLRLFGNQVAIHSKRRGPQAFACHWILHSRRLLTCFFYSLPVKTRENQRPFSQLLDFWHLHWLRRHIYGKTLTKMLVVKFDMVFPHHWSSKHFLLRHHQSAF